MKLMVDEMPETPMNCMFAEYDGYYESHICSLDCEQCGLYRGLCRNLTDVSTYFRKCACDDYASNT